MSILITGCAGFIGSHVTKRLLDLGYSVIGIDNMNNYYDINLKRKRLENLETPNFKFYELSLEQFDSVRRVFSNNSITHVINLAAQAGVRNSMDNPQSYINSNIVGFSNLLDICRIFEIQHLVYASSSSVYGANRKLPYTEKDNVDHPVSLYAATKKTNELLAHSYSHLYNLPTTGIRFFTVYGPWGRPDMAYFSFTKDILSGNTIKVFNNGEMKRDFTYIDDIVDGLLLLLWNIPKSYRSEDPFEIQVSRSHAPYAIYNIGNSDPVPLMKLISIIERNLGKQAKIEFLPKPKGDVLETYANIESMTSEFGFIPKYSIEQGMEKFLNWYKSFYL